MNTNESAVRWAPVVLAAFFLTLTFFLTRKSGLPPKLGPLIFLVSQGCITLPFLVYTIGATIKSPFTIPFTLGSALISMIILVMIRLSQSSLTYHVGNSVYVGWTIAGATLGILGMLLILGELSRLSMFAEGHVSFGVALCTANALQFLGQAFYNYYFGFPLKDVVPVSERLSPWQVVGLILVPVGIMLFAKPKDFTSYIQNYSDKVIAEQAK